MRKFLCAFWLLLGSLSSCTMSQVQYVEASSVSDTSKSGGDCQNLGHVYAESWGILVLSKLPYLTGGVDEDGQPEWAYWRNEVKVETVITLLKAEAKRRGATHLIDVQTNWISEWSAPSLIFWIAETEGSATALRVTGEAPPGALPL